MREDTPKDFDEEEIDNGQPTVPENYEEVELEIVNQENVTDEEDMEPLVQEVKIDMNFDDDDQDDVEVESESESESKLSSDSSVDTIHDDIQVPKLENIEDSQVSSLSEDSGEISSKSENDEEQDVDEEDLGNQITSDYKTHNLVPVSSEDEVDSSNDSSEEEDVEQLNVEQESSSDEEQIIADEYEEPAKNNSVKSDFNTVELENHAKEESVDQSDIKDVEHYPIIKPEFEGHQDVGYSEEPESNEDDIDEEHPQLNPITDELDNHYDAVEETNLSRKRGNEGDLESSMKRLRTAVGSFVTGIFNRKDKISQHFENSTEESSPNQTDDDNETGTEMDINNKIEIPILEKELESLETIEEADSEELHRDEAEQIYQDNENLDLPFELGTDANFNEEKPTDLASIISSKKIFEYRRPVIMKRRTRRRGRRTLKWLHMITNELELIQADKLNESRLTENQEPNDEEAEVETKNLLEGLNTSDDSVENNRSVMNIKKEVENNLDTDSDVQNEEQKINLPKVRDNSKKKQSIKQRFMGLLPEELEELGLDPNAVSEESNEDESTRRGRRLRSQDSKPSFSLQSSPVSSIELRDRPASRTRSKSPLKQSMKDILKLEKEIKLENERNSRVNSSSRLQYKNDESRGRLRKR